MLEVSLVAASRGYSLVAVHGFLTAVDSVVVEHGLSCSATCGLPRPGVELASPALAGGRFFTTEPPGKPSGVF